MIPNPTRRVLFTFSEHGVKSLLIGGQACILYGAVEFSRATDFIILCDHFNHSNLKKALRSLEAEQIYVPPLELRYLVASKKTQRDKDWLMLTRLVDNDILLTTKPDQDKIRWWLFECRTVETLEELCKRYEKTALSIVGKRPVLKYVLSGNKQKTVSCLEKEERIEREADREYWVPLKKELEQLRRETR